MKRLIRWFLALPFLLVPCQENRFDTLLSEGINGSFQFGEKFDFPNLDKKRRDELKQKISLLSKKERRKNIWIYLVIIVVLFGVFSMFIFN
ncbi:hypothetical protein [Lutibacter sp.]|uniref:hypothetical protein n=1 Tax=Lutibacter sp. TaxID=1925666 RepID=UPI003564DC77